MGLNLLNNMQLLFVGFPETLTPLWISIKTAIASTMLTSSLGLLAAKWMMSRALPRSSGWRQGAIDSLFTLPLVLPPTVIGFLLLLLLGQNSPVGQLLALLDISVIFTWAAVVIAATVVSFPLMYKTSLSALAQVDSTIIDAARTLGASEWEIFWQILLPLAWPGILAGIVLSFARSLGEFGATLMVGGSIPGITQTMPIALFFAAESGQMDVALAWMIITTSVSLGAIAFINFVGSQNQQKKNSPRRWVKQGFNVVYFGGADIDLSKRKLPSPSVKNRTVVPELLVSIASSFSAFQLSARFNTDGQPLGILGASGSGKSLTLRCIAGLETPMQGKVVLNGRTLFDSAMGTNVDVCDRKVGFVFQTYALFPHLTIAQNIAFGMQAIPRHHRSALVATYLQTMELEELGDRYPHQISGGQQQRTALARALAAEPDILLLDEPLSALDTYLRSQIEKLLLRSLTHYPGITLFVTHKLEEAYRLCPNLLVLSNGQILANNTREQIFRHPPTFSVAQITECKNFSRIRQINSHQIEAIDWNCSLTLAPSKSNEATLSNAIWTGIRAHHIRFSDRADAINTFPGWIASISETQHRVTLYIKLHNQPKSAQDYHLQAEVYREKWELVSRQASSLYVQLRSDYLMLMAE